MGRPGRERMRVSEGRLCQTGKAAPGPDALLKTWSHLVGTQILGQELAFQRITY